MSMAHADQKQKMSENVGYTHNDHFTCLEGLQQIQQVTRIDPINLDYCGMEECTPGYEYGPNIRTSYVIHMIASGKGCLLRDGRNWNIEKGDAFLIRPKEECTYQADEYDPWRYLWIGFHGPRADEMARHAGFPEERPVMHCRNMDEICRHMTHLLEARDLTYVNSLIRMSELYAIFALLTENASVPAEEKTQDGRMESLYVESAIDLLINARGDVKVADVAHTIGISRSYLTSVFKKETGLSPQQYLMNFRMEKAANLLRSTLSPVNVVAEEVGYSDSLAFSRAFKNYYGKSPTAFRARKPVLELHTVKNDPDYQYPL